MVKRGQIATSERKGEVLFESVQIDFLQHLATVERELMILM